MDARGNAQTLSYDAGGLLTSVADGLGRELTFAYDGKDRLISVSDGTRTVLFELSTDYDKLLNVTDGRGNKVVSYEHWGGSTGRIRRIHHNRGGSSYKVTQFSITNDQNS